MKLKKWGAILLALCMMFMAFPITAMANDYNTSGPLGEKKVIENNLIIQFPPSVDEMIGTSPSGWLAVTSESTWEDGTILDFVYVDQKFYDSTGKEMTDDDKFQNNSQYMVKTTFQSFEYYYGDYYYVLSGKNKVYVDINRQRYPMTVTVGTDANGNPVISATYSFSIGTPTEEPMETKPIYKISSVKLSNTAYTYNGKAKKPTVTVKDRTGKVISSKNYTVTYEKGRVNVGTYKVTVKFKGNYAGTVTKSFKINPKATGIVSATGKSKSAVVKWKKSTKQVTGYQIRYASKSNMANAKSVLVSKNTIVSKKISKLKAKKTYYIQVRTYKTVKGTKYYSAWSKVKKVKTKK